MIDQDTSKALVLGREWQRQHSAHVRRLLDKPCSPIKPEGGDLLHPELWKDIHWRWWWNNQFSS